MEVQGHPGIFALGDVVDTPERKQAAKGQHHLRVVVPNVVNFLEGRPLSKEYKGVPEMIVIPLGKVSSRRVYRLGIALMKCADRRIGLPRRAVGDYDWRLDLGVRGG